MIKHIDFIKPKRYEYDEMGNPFRIYTEQENLRFQLLIKTSSCDFLLKIYANSDYTNYESELERRFEESINYPEEFENQEAFSNIDNYLMLFEGKQLHNHTNTSLNSLKIILEQSINFIKMKMKKQIEEFEIKYESRKNSLENEDDYEGSYEEEFEDYDDSNHDEEHNYEREMELIGELSPWTTLRDKVEFSLKMLNEEITFNDMQNKEMENRIKNSFRKFDL